MQLKNLNFMINNNQPKEIPDIKVSEGILVITITAEELQHIAESNPESNYKVINKNGFLEDFANELRSFAKSNATEKGLSEFQYLLDEIIDETYISASKNIIVKTNLHNSK